LENYGFREGNLGVIVLGKTLGILKQVPLFLKFMSMGHCFLALGKLVSPHFDNLLDFFPNLGKGRGIFPYHVQLWLKLGNVTVTRQ